MFLLFVVSAIVFAVGYAAIMLLYWCGWRRMPEFVLPEDVEPDTRVTVIIPARNEAEQIGACLKSILSGSYPIDLVEIIVVDDYSEDDTPAVVLDLSENLRDRKGRSPVRLLHLSDFTRAGDLLNSYKKKAITAAISQAYGEFIVTTDADCTAPKDWLKLLVARRVPAVEAVAAPVLFYQEKTIFEHFQSLDFLGLMGITGAGIHLGFQRMGNGANLAYPKAVFQEVGGFEGSENIASGDDMFLIQKIAKRYPGGVRFLKSRHAAIQTNAKPDWKSFMQQRIRWGTKNAALPEWRVKVILATVFLFCWMILGTATYCLLFAAQNKPTDMWYLLLALLALKALPDFIFLREICRFFRREDLLPYFWPSFFLHIMYIAGIGLASVCYRQYEWKGRRVR